jgi:hypothetical protein
MPDIYVLKVKESGKPKPVYFRIIGEKARGRSDAVYKLLK